MKLLEKLESISLPQIKKLEKGNAASLKEFWDHLIAQYLPRKETVLAWHELLMKYIKTDHPTFAIRGYNSVPSRNQYHELRRGFLSKADDFSFFYTDNYHAAYYQKMVLDGYVPTLNEFAEAFRQRKFPSRFGRITQEETALLAIKKGHDPKINASGFKLAHIIPVGKDYSFNNKTIGNKVILDQYFPKGERSDWRLKHDANGNYYERDIHLKPDAKRYAIAHFLRFVHPFNYFLCPKTNRETNNKCKEIAEYHPLLDLAHNYMLDTYGNAYLEYLSYVMVEDRYYQKTQRIDLDLDIRYGSDIIPTDRIKACLEAIKEAEDIKKRVLASLSEKTSEEEISQYKHMLQQIENIISEYNQMLQEEIQKLSEKDDVSDENAKEKPQIYIVERYGSKKADTKDRGSYLFKGTKYNKRSLVLAVVKAYVRDNPAITYTELKTIFYDNLQGSWGVISTPDRIRARTQEPEKRFFMQDKIILKDGTNVCVCTQWGAGLNIERFIARAEKIGYKITRIGASK